MQGPTVEQDILTLFKHTQPITPMTGSAAEQDIATLTGMYRERPHDMRTAALPDRDLLPAQDDGVIDHTPARYEEEEAP